MVYDTVHKLARELKESDEFKAYKAAKETAFANETNSALIKEYQKLSFEAQAAMASGGAVRDETKEKLTKLYAVISLSNECMMYLMAEYTFNKALGDVFKIISDAVGIDLGFLSD